MDRARPASTFFSISVSIGAALFLLLLMLPFISSSPLQTLWTFISGPFSSRFYFGNYLNRAGLYILAGLAMVVSFQGGVFNLGGEGQVYGGALGTTMVLLLVPRLGAVSGLSLIHI